MDRRMKNGYALGLAVLLWFHPTLWAADGASPGQRATNSTATQKPPSPSPAASRQTPSSQGSPQGPAKVTDTGLAITPQTRALLQTEMQAMMKALQATQTALLSGDWEIAARLSEQMRDSYVLGKRLSDEQKSDLGQRLPEDFRQLDGGLRWEAGRLADAARKQDRELAAFHYYRMVERCIICHAVYAQDRFPGFAAQ